MNSKRNLLIEDSNLTIAWLKTARHLLSPGTDRLTHLEVRIKDFKENHPQEHDAARVLLDTSLRAIGPCDTNATANLLFPESAWRLAQGRGMTQVDFLEHYREKLLPRIKSQHHLNHAGTYFGRMVAYPTKNNEELNQLGEILKMYGTVSRQSAYQVMIYNPGEDLDRQPYMPFPCLDYLAFTKDGSDLIVSAFYATQLLFDRALGNYLGLCRLGAFVAGYCKLNFVQLSCHVGQAKISSRMNKNQLQKLVSQMEKSVQELPTRKLS